MLFQCLSAIRRFYSSHILMKSQLIFSFILLCLSKNSNYVFISKNSFTAGNAKMSAVPTTCRHFPVVFVSVHSFQGIGTELVRAASALRA